MKTTEFMDWLHEVGFAKVFLGFMAIGLIAASVALAIIYFHIRS